MSDNDDSSNETADLVVKALKNIAIRYQSVDLHAASRQPPWDVDAETWVHDNWKFARQEPLSIDEISTLNDLLCQMQTRHLPSLQQQLVNLSRSLDLANLPNNPHPKLEDTLEILSQLGDSLDQINTFVHSIAPIVVNPLQQTGKIDHHFGGLKNYRSRELIEKFNNLERESLKWLFDSLRRFIRASPKDPWTILNDESILGSLGKDVIEAIDQSYHAISEIIKWSKQSDFSILQDECRRDANNLEPILEGLNRRIALTTRLEEQLRLIDEGEFDTDSSSASGDEDDEESKTSLSTDSSEQIFLRPSLMKLAKTTIPLIKLIRIFFNKLSNTPTSKAPFTFGTKLSSAEIREIDCEIGGLSCSIRNLLNLIFYMFDCDEYVNDMKNLEQHFKELPRDFNSSIVLLCCYLLPVNDQLDLPVSGNLFKTWFLTLREQFDLAYDNFRQAFSRFKEEIQA
ncbi:hypothetical protein PGT21_014631 [Puccinia graminis f. sp. tritici]|uniref:Uncharacterized protein n=1 Tax=Puccinia graminis f. sp. tritici TaxID=56615 RepID=A0A5B0N458_PUCGR|nr:hypothetical protein PGT21_014631 [Puccinia graminis f. sp. tritici]KAA1093254.1 hypothetical protein PGTUg99_003649 [Puccinia graminis f. sp. tritici]